MVYINELNTEIGNTIFCTTDFRMGGIGYEKYNLHCQDNTNF